MTAPNQMHADHFSEEDERDASYEAGPGKSSDDEWLDEARRESERRRASRQRSVSPSEGEHTDRSGGSHSTEKFIGKDGQSAPAGSNAPGSNGPGSNGPGSHRAVRESDEELFLRYQRGDQRAFLVLYDRYKASIFAYCAKVMMGVGLSQEQIEDTFQDVFLRLAQYQHTFTGGEFKAWIFTVTRHSCLSAKKKALRIRMSTEYVGDAENLDEETTMEVRAALSSRADDPLERMSKQEQIDLLHKAIAALPDTYREALILCDYEGMTYDEIGKLTGTSLSTIRIRVFRAKVRLRKMLLPILGDQVEGLVPLPDSPTEE